MLIELNLLPPNIAQQILQTQQGAVVHFTYQGKVVADVVPTHSSYDFFMNMNYPDDVADVADEIFERKTSSRMEQD